MIQSIMKLLVSLLIFCCFPAIAALGTFLFSVYENHRHLELIVVMLLGPCCLNAIQFWVSFYCRCMHIH